MKRKPLLFKVSALAAVSAVTNTAMALQVIPDDVQVQGYAEVTGQSITNGITNTGDIYSTNDITAGGDLYAYGDSIVNGYSYVAYNSYVGGDSIVYGGSYVADDLYVGGDSNVYGDAFVSGTTLLNDTLTVQPAVTSTTTVTPTGGAGVPTQIGGIVNTPNGDVIYNQTLIDTTEAVQEDTGGGGATIQTNGDTELSSDLTTTTTVNYGRAVTFEVAQAGHMTTGVGLPVPGSEQYYLVDENDNQIAGPFASEALLDAYIAANSPSVLLAANPTIGTEVTAEGGGGNLIVHGNSNLGDTEYDTTTVTGALNVTGDTTTTGDAIVNGDSTVTGTSTTDSLDVTNDVTVGGDVQVDGAILDVNGDNLISLQPDGTIHIGENSLVLDQTGDAAGVGGVQELSGQDVNGDAIDLVIAGGSDLVVSNDLSVTGYTSTNGISNTGDVYTTDDLIAGDDIIALANSTVYGSSYVANDSTVGGNSYVTDDSVVGGDSIVFGDSYVINDSIVYGDSYVGGSSYVALDSTVAGNSTVYGDSTVLGTTTTNGIDNAGNLETDTLDVKGDANVEGTLTVKTPDPAPVSVGTTPIATVPIGNDKNTGFTAGPEAGLIQTYSTNGSGVQTQTVQTNGGVVIEPNGNVTLNQQTTQEEVANYTIETRELKVSNPAGYTDVLGTYGPAGTFYPNGTTLPGTAEDIATLRDANGNLVSVLSDIAGVGPVVAVDGLGNPILTPAQIAAAELGGAPADFLVAAAPVTDPNSGSLQVGGNANVDGTLSVGAVADVEAELGGLQDNIDTETAARELADAGLAADIADETDARILGDDLLAADIAQEVLDRTNGDDLLQDNIDTVENDSIDRDNGLQADIDQEVADRTALIRQEADGIHIGPNSLVLNEVGGVQQMSAQDIGANAINIDVTNGSDLLVNGVSVATDADVTAEAAARAAADTTLTNNLAAEVTRATTAEGVLQTNINTEAATRAAADTTLTNNLATEVTRATTAEGVLQTNINTEAATRAAADTTLTNNLAAEVTRATAAEGVLTTNLASEVTNRIADVDAEQARAIAAESLLTTNLNNEAATRAAADTSIRNDFAAADTAIRNDFRAADGRLQNQIDANSVQIDRNTRGIAMVAAMTNTTIQPGMKQAIDFNLAQFDDATGFGFGYGYRVNANLQINAAGASTTDFEEGVFRLGLSYQW